MDAPPLRKDCNIPALKQKIFKMINDKSINEYEFWIALKNNINKVYMTVDELQDDLGHNLLHLAVHKQNPDLFDSLLCMGWWKQLTSQKVSKSGNSKYRGQSALQIANTKTTQTTATALMKCNKLEDSLTNLMVAARVGDDDEVKKKIKSYPQKKLNAKDKNNGNALYWAVVSGKKSTLNLLLQARLDHTMRTLNEETLLHVACRLGHSKVIAQLLDLKVCDGKDKNTNGKNVFDICAENGDVATLIELAKKLAVPDSILMVAALNGKTPFLKYCIEQLKMPIDSRDDYNRTPLHRAIKGNMLVLLITF